MLIIKIQILEVKMANIQRQQVVITKTGGPEVLQLQESSLSEPLKNEICIEVGASGINFADILARQGLYQDAPALPSVIGYEVSGKVIAVGSDVDESWLGKAVLALTHFGGYSSHINVPVEQVFEIDSKLDCIQAASIPVAYLTAYELMVVLGNLQPTDTVLIHNAGGGVGLALLDIAKHIGATIIGTASKGKHEFLKSRGLDHAIDYQNEDWFKVLMELTHNKGVELITDPLGGSNWRASYRALRATGRLGMFGVSEASSNGIMGKFKLLKTAVSMPFFHPINLMNQNKSVFGVNMGRLWHEVPRIQHWTEVILDGVQQGWVRPEVDKTFKFSQAGEAHQYIEDRKNKGKVVLIPD